MLLQKYAHAQYLRSFSAPDGCKLSSEVVNMLEKEFEQMDDKPEDFMRKRKSKYNRQPRRGLKRYQGKTPRTSLNPKHPFSHILDLHDEYAKNNASDFGVLGEYPFR